MSLRSLGSLAIGVALGSGAAWSVQHLRSPRPADTTLAAGATSSARAAAPASGAAPLAPALVLPEPLAGAEADSALEAFLALPPLAKGSPSAEVQERVERLRALLTILPDSHLERLLSALATRTGDSEAQVRRVAFDIWCERAAPEAARWALGIAPGEAINAATRSRYVGQAAGAWAREDFSAAWAWANSLADATLRKSTLPQLLSQLASTDPRKALELIPGDDEELARNTRRAVFQAWSQRDPVAAIRNLGATLLEQRGQEWTVQQALVKWAAKDPGAAIDWAAAQPPADGESYRSLLNNIGWYLTETPASVRPFIDALVAREDFAGRESALQNIVGPWIQKDAKAALAWLETVSDVAQRSDLVTRALGYIEAGKPDQFMELVKRLPPSESRDDQVAQHFTSWAKRDPDAALAWIAEHPSPELAPASRRIEGVLLGNLAASDPQAAIARWKALPADAPRAEISVQLAQVWAKSDSAAATRWFAQQLPADYSGNSDFAQRSHEIGRLAINWITSDPLGYAEWAETLPKGLPRDQALNALTGSHWFYHSDEFDPPPRAAYAGRLARIKDPSLRDRALGAHLSRWMQSDRQAARAWIESSDALSPEAAARLLTNEDTNY